MSKKSSSFQRLVWVDYAKGIGIFMVVLGHTIRGLVNSSILESSTAVQAVDSCIYAFHMPLFFLISGLFVYRSVSKPLKDFLVEKLQVIAYPYLVWSVLQTILQALGSQHTNNNSISLSEIWQIIYSPVMQFWFLYVLFVILIIYAIARNLLGVSNILFAIICILFYGLKEYIGLESWGVLYLVQTYAIYLGLGALIGDSKALSRLQHKTMSTLVWVTLGGFGIVALAVLFNLTEEKWLKLAIALCGICASLTGAMLLERLDIARFVEQWGRLSLEIYLAHTIASSILRIVLQKLLHLSDPSIHIILGTAVGIYAPMALAIICQRQGIRYIFTLRDRSSAEGRSLGVLHKSSP
jgi:fucose 4-O-acetylase-like acetyltransferase